MTVGTLSTIEVPRAGLLAVYTEQVRRNNRYPSEAKPRDDSDVASREAASDSRSKEGADAAGEDDRIGSGGPVPTTGGGSPIKHVIYIINAEPMRALFHGRLAPDDAAPYTALPEGTSPTEVNTASSFRAAASVAMDFDAEDRAPMAELSEIIWGAVRGPDVPYPAASGGATAAPTRTTARSGRRRRRSRPWPAMDRRIQTRRGGTTAGRPPHRVTP